MQPVTIIIGWTNQEGTVDELRAGPGDQVVLYGDGRVLAFIRDKVHHLTAYQYINWVL